MKPCQAFKPLNSVISCCLVYSSSTCCIYKPYFDIVLIFKANSPVFHRSLFQPLDIPLAARLNIAGKYWFVDKVMLSVYQLSDSDLAKSPHARQVIKHSQRAISGRQPNTESYRVKEGFVTDQLANNYISVVIQAAD